MKKFFDQFTVLFILLISLMLFAGCFNNDDDEEEKNPANQAHVVVLNYFTSPNNINSIRFDLGANVLSSPLLPSKHFHMSYDVPPVGLDVDISDSAFISYPVHDMDIALGQVLYIEYDGTDVNYLVGVYTDYIQYF